MIIEPEPDDPDFARVMVDATIAGRPYRLVLDTGAARSQVDADEYTSALPPVGQADSSGALGGKVTEPVVTVTDVAVGPLRLETLDVKRSDRRLGQVLGMDVLGRCPWFLQLEAGVLDLDVPSSPRPYNDLTLGPRGHVYLDASWPAAADSATATACWDTGASATVVDRAFWLKHPELFEQAGATTGTDASGAQADTPVLLMAGPVIGQHQFGRHKAVAVDLSPMNVTLDRPIDLILGYPTIRQVNWLLDVPARRWAVVPLASLRD